MNLLMLKKELRLRRTQDFNRVMAGRKIASFQPFVVLGLFAKKMPAEPEKKEAPAYPLPKFGIIVSKKIDKRASRRNRIKRRIREIIRTRLIPNASQNTLPQYSAIVIVVRSTDTQYTFAEMAQHLEYCFKKKMLVKTPLNKEKPQDSIR